MSDKTTLVREFWQVGESPEPVAYTDEGGNGWIMGVRYVKADLWDEVLDAVGCRACSEHLECDRHPNVLALVRGNR